MPKLPTMSRRWIAAALFLTASTSWAAGLQYATSSTWNSGLTANVSVKADPGAPLQNWRVEFDYPYLITNIWRARVVSKNGNRYVIEGPSWALSIPAGGEAKFGFNADHGGTSTAVPSNCRINGVAPTTGTCAGGGGTAPNKPPVAKANGDYSGAVNAPISFSAAGSSDPDGSIARYTWNFGDGSSDTSTTASIQHRYALAGKYTATLTVTDNKGATAQARAGVTVSAGDTPPSTGTPVARNGQLSVCGTQLCNAAGKAIQLRGMSGHGLQWFPQCYSNNALDALAKDWGADVVRLAMYIQEGGYETDPAGYKLRIDKLIEAASQRGMYVIVDWHILTPGNPVLNETAARDFFDYMAGKHGSRNNVLYEIANEPNGASWADIKGYAERIIPVIRAKAPKAVVLVGTRGWSSLGVSEGSNPEEIIKAPVASTNFMYSFHFYAKSHQDPYRDALTRSLGKLPIFVTEFGTQEFTGDGANDFVSAQKYLDFFRTHKISWVNWNFADDSRSGAVLKQGSCAANAFTGAALKESGTWIRDRMLSPADEF